MLTPRRVFFTLVVVFVITSLLVAAGTPAWEANDEPDHVRNVQTLASGEAYRIEPGAGLEPVQPPLYYYILAGWQTGLGLEVRMPAPPYGGPGNFDHGVASDGVDQRRVVLLRLPSIALGLLTILLTAQVARRLTTDPWTPVVAAGVVVGVPKFTFLSGVINNDNLSNAVGALATLVAITAVARPPATRGKRFMIAATLGVLAGLLLLTKVTAAALVPGLILAVWYAGRHSRERLAMGAILLGAMAAVCGWWLIRNQVWYGDPLGGDANRDYIRQVIPSVLDVEPSIERAVSTVPRKLWSSFWYTSGWNQFYWADSRYLPFWGLSLIGILALVLPRRVLARPDWPRGVLPVLSVLSLGALSTVWAVGVQTTEIQGRLTFVGIAAMATLVALGYERLRLPPPLRFVLPVLGVLATFYALHHHVLNVYGI